MEERRQSGEQEQDTDMHGGMGHGEGDMEHGDVGSEEQHGEDGGRGMEQDGEVGMEQDGEELGMEEGEEQGEEGKEQGEEQGEEGQEDSEEDSEEQGKEQGRERRIPPPSKRMPWPKIPPGFKAWPAHLPVPPRPVARSSLFWVVQPPPPETREMLGDEEADRRILMASLGMKGAQDATQAPGTSSQDVMGSQHATQAPDSQHVTQNAEQSGIPNDPTPDRSYSPRTKQRRADERQAAMALRKRAREEAQPGPAPPAKERARPPVEHVDGQQQQQQAHVDGHDGGKKHDAETRDDDDRHDSRDADCDMGNDDGSHDGGQKHGADMTRKQADHGKSDDDSGPDGGERAGESSGLLRELLDKAKAARTCFE